MRFEPDYPVRDIFNMSALGSKETSPKIQTHVRSADKPTEATGLECLICDARPPVTLCHQRTCSKASIRVRAEAATRHLGFIQTKITTNGRTLSGRSEV
jgi:hypothetical protein